MTGSLIQCPSLQLAEVLGRWVSSWLSLEGEGQYLRWFKQQPPPEGPRKQEGYCLVSTIADARQRFPGVGSSWPVPEVERCFVVGTPGKIYYFVAHTAEEKELVTFLYPYLHQTLHEGVVFHHVDDLML